MSTLERATIFALIQKEWKLLLTIFIAGILFYIYPICNQSIPIDNLGHVTTSTFGWYLSSNRWGITLVQKLFFMRTVVPSFWLITNLALLAFACVITCDLFKFKKEWVKYLYGILIVSFPQYSYMVKYICTADGIGVGFVLVALGFWISEHSSSWKSNFAVLLLFIGTFSIYVSLIFIPLVLFLLLSAIRFSEEDLSIKDWLKQAARLGIITALAYVIYIGISKVILLYYGMSTETPAYFTNMIRWGKDPITDILHRILKEIGKHFEGRAYFGEKSFVLIWIPFVISLYFIFRQKVCANKKLLGTLLLITGMIAPFIQIILLGAYQPPRVLFAQPFLFAPLWCIALRNLPKIRAEWVFTGLVILFVHNGYRITQYFHSDTMSEQIEKNLALRIMSRLDSMGIRLEEHRLFIVGGIDLTPKFSSNSASFQRDDISHSFSYGGYRSPFFLLDHGFTNQLVKLPTKEMIEELTPIIEAMPIWPAQQSIILHNNVVIIKLNNNYIRTEWTYPDRLLPKN